MIILSSSQGRTSWIDANELSFIALSLYHDSSGFTLLTAFELICVHLTHSTLLYVFVQLGSKTSVTNRLCYLFYFAYLKMKYLPNSINILPKYQGIQFYQVQNELSNIFATLEIFRQIWSHCRKSCLESLATYCTSLAPHWQNGISANLHCKHHFADLQKRRLTKCRLTECHSCL